jgi:integrase/recombinase XerD
MSQISVWDQDPVAAFDAFVQTTEFIATSRRRRPADVDPEPVSDESAAIYRFMFNKFVSWMNERGLVMSTVDGQALYGFLNKRYEDGSRQLNSRIAHRYLRLLERCYEHLALRPNPAQATILDAARSATPLGRDQEMTVLTAEQMDLVMQALPAPALSWKRRRDRAMQCLMLQAGLRVAEVIGFQVSEASPQLALDGSLALELTPTGKHQSSYQHTAKLRAEAVPELLGWLAERRRMAIPGTYAFPANYRGDPLNKATVYRQVKATLARAGIDVARSGGRTLRNTFAVQELDSSSIMELTEQLGLALPRSTELYVNAKKRQR